MTAGCSGETFVTGAAGAGVVSFCCAPRQQQVAALPQQCDAASEGGHSASAAQGAIATNHPATVSAINFRTSRR
jgi:hypothetical protein